MIVEFARYENYICYVYNQSAWMYLSMHFLFFDFINYNNHNKKKQLNFLKVINFLTEDLFEIPELLDEVFEEIHRTNMANYEALLQSPAKPLGVWVGDRMCIMGDVGADKFAFGTPDDVYNYSIKLIRDLGPTGFILCSGCDIPFNAKKENVEAMYRAVEDTAGKLQ